MKILFIENRYKTIFWEEIAKGLIDEGHEIYWIVQNHFFKPEIGKSIVLPYFKGQNIHTKKYSDKLNKIIRSNRGINYFGIKSDNFLFFYERKIKNAFDSIRPELVFGESTLFHELLCINEASNRNILYLHPTTCRYPVNRFSFYKYDTLKPFSGCGYELISSEAKQIVLDIKNRTVKPDYMLPPLHLSYFEILFDKMRLSFAYLLGERFNTPNPWIKRKIEKVKTDLIKRWDKDALNDLKADKKFKILYPLQMQPEANIDVWGYPNNNQLELIKKISSRLGKDDILYVKPNPKSKYELTEELLSFVNSNPNIVALHHNSKMGDLLNQFNLVITVTGTIAIECSMSNIPVVMLGESITTENNNCLRVNVEKELKSVIKSIKDSSFPKMTLEEQSIYIANVYMSSFEGVIGDGLHNRNSLIDERNFSLVYSAFRKVVEDVYKNQNI